MTDTQTQVVKTCRHIRCHRNVSSQKKSSNAALNNRHLMQLTPSVSVSESCYVYHDKLIHRLWTHQQPGFDNDGHKQWRQCIRLL